MTVLAAALAAMPTDRTAALTPEQVAAEVALQTSRPTFAALASNPVVAAVRAARQRLAVRIGWNATAEGVAVTVDGFRLNAKGLPTGCAHTVTLAKGLTPAAAVALLASL